MIVILEGPDGAGKTTLARQLQERYKLDYHHEGPPPRGIHPLEHYGAVLDSFRGKNVVIDRFALGERVYGPVLRGEDKLGNWGWRLIQRLMQATAAFEVICLPPFSVCRDNWASGRPELIKEEQRLRDTYNLFQVFTYDDFVFNYVNRGHLRSLHFCLDLLSDACQKNPDAMTMPPGYIGRPNAKYLFVGERGSNPHAKHDLPFFANVGSSQYLNECIETAGFRETEIAFVNAIARTTLNGVPTYKTRPIKKFPQIIALGSAAADVLDDQGLRYSLVPHPQFWKRFHHNDKQGYVEKLRQCRIS